MVCTVTAQNREVVRGQRNVYDMGYSEDEAQTLANCPEGPRKMCEADFAAPEKWASRGNISGNKLLLSFAGRQQPW